MKTLVIHPKDRSTDFLKPIYHGRNDTTVITGGCTKEDVNDAIDKHDHIIMLGHGTPQGLLAMGNFDKKKPPYTPKPSTVIKGLAGDLPVKKEHIKSFYTPSQTVIKDDEDDWFDNRKVGGNFGGYQGNYQSLSTTYIVDESTADHLRGKKLTTIWCNADQYIEWNDLGGFYTGMFISEEGEAKMIGTADTEKWQVEESNYAFVSIVRRFLDHDAEKLHNALNLEYGEMASRNAIAKYNLHRFYSKKAAQTEIFEPGKWRTHDSI